MKDILKLISFIQAYPFYVKIIIALWLFLTVIMIIAFIFEKHDIDGSEEETHPITNKKKVAPISTSTPLKRDTREPIKIIQILGGPGTGNGQFRFGGGSDTNAGIFVDEQFLYVTDWTNNRLQIFKLNKENVWSYHDSLSISNHFYSDISVDSLGNIYLQGQNEISIYDSNKQLISNLKVDISNFRRFTLDKSNNLFLQSGSDNNVVKKYNNNGELLLSFGGFGSSDGKFDNSGWTADIVTDSVGNVYMQDIGSGKVQKFDNNGVFLNKWAINTSAYSYMAIDELDNIYVVENGFSEIRKYDTDGNLIKKHSLPQAVFMSGGSYLFVKNNKLFISHHSDHNIKILSLSD